MDEVKTVMKATFALLTAMVVVAVVADRIMDNPAKASRSDHKT
ncbi:MAG TPA: hypothetical protein VLR26_13020 [Frankiaceae bacterium]|nr:hypothetical protein [Frankiaceae bacterium]